MEFIYAVTNRAGSAHLHLMRLKAKLGKLDESVK